MTGANGAALLLIDAQVGIDDPRHGVRNNPDADANIATLLTRWRDAGRPVIHVRHDSADPESALRPGLPGNAFKPEAMPAPGEPLFAKSVNSAFIGTSLESHLRDHGLDTLIIAGFTTDHCISTTARMAANLGFAVTVVSDATATHERVGPDGVHHTADAMHRLALASLHGEFATVRPTVDVLAALDGATTT